MLSPLRNRNFRLLLTGQVCSLAGDQFFVVALPFLVLGRARADTLGAVLFAYGLARIAVLPLGGLLADRFRHTRLMLVSNASRMIILAGLTIVPLNSLWPLFLLVALTGAFEGMFLPASWSLLPEILAEDLIGPGNALLTGATMGTTLVGPAVAGLLVAVASPRGAFVVDAVSFGISVLSLLWIRPVGKTSEERAEPVAADAQSTGNEAPTTFWQLLRTSTYLKFTIAIAIIANLAYAGAGQVALPVFSKESLNSGARGYGLLLSAVGLGMLVGALFSGKLFNLPGRGKVALGLGVIQGVAFMLVPAGNNLWVGIAMLAVAEFCNGINNVFYITRLQQKLPAHLRGRGMSALLMCMYGVYPIAVSVSGIVIDGYGTLPIFLFAGSTVFAGFALGFFSSDYRAL
jgi:MFS family permease